MKRRNFIQKAGAGLLAVGIGVLLSSCGKEEAVAAGAD